jgi:hypothetical protein
VPSGRRQENPMHTALLGTGKVGAIAVFIGAAVLEVLGDALIRKGMRGSGVVMVGLGKVDDHLTLRNVVFGGDAFRPFLGPGASASPVGLLSPIATAIRSFDPCGGRGTGVPGTLGI